MARKTKPYNKENSEKSRNIQNKVIKSYNYRGGRIEKLRTATLNVTAEPSDKYSIDDITLNTMAERLLDEITIGIKTVGKLTLLEKVILFEFFDKFSPLVGRILDLHVNLPISTLQLRTPNIIDNPIVNDYIYDTFYQMINDTDFNQLLHVVVRNYWKFGIGALQIIDDFEFSKDVTDIDFWDIDSISKLVKDKPTDKEILKKIDDITAKYVSTPDLVPVADRRWVIEQFISLPNPNYKGIKKVSVIDPFCVIDRDSNEDINYFIYPIQRSKSLDRILNQSFSGYNARLAGDTSPASAKAKRIGYSDAMIKAHSDIRDNYINVDTDPFNDMGMYAVSLERSGGSDIDNSLLNRIIEPICNIINAKRKQRELVGLASKVTRLVKAMGASDDQLADLDSQLRNAAEEQEGALVITNYEVSIEDLSLDGRESLDVQNIIDNETKDVTNSLGMTDSLIGGEDSYGSTFMKIELLVNEYTAFRVILKDFIENKIFKPIAMKKGFITRDQWGKPQVIFPEISFDRLSIARSSEDFQMLLDLAKEGKLPWENVYTTLGFNIQEVENKLVTEKTSVINEATSNMLNQTIEGFGEALEGNKEIAQRLKDNLYLKEPIDLTKAENPDHSFNESEASIKPVEKPQPRYNTIIQAKLTTASALALEQRIRTAMGAYKLPGKLDINKLNAILVEARNQPAYIEADKSLKKDLSVVSKYDTGSAVIEVENIPQTKDKQLVVKFNNIWLQKRNAYLAEKYKVTQPYEKYTPYIILGKLPAGMPDDYKAEIKCKLVFDREIILKYKG